MLNAKIMATIVLISFGLVVYSSAGAVLTKMPVLSDADRKVVSTGVSVELVEYSSDLIKNIGQRLGLIEKETDSCAIVKNDNVLAVVPSNSKFIDVQLHDDCLKWQYGTDNWWICEKRISDNENMDWSNADVEVYAPAKTEPINVEPIEDIGKELVVEGRL